MKKKNLFFIFPFAVLFANCAGMIQRGGEFLEGDRNRFAGMETSLYRSKVENRKDHVVELREIVTSSGEWVLEIENSGWPGIIFRGERNDARGGFEIYEARILSTHSRGWNYFRLDISGNAVFDNSRLETGTLFINGVPDREEINSGRIRLHDSRISGTRAETALQSRRERILALNEWMESWLIETVQEREFLNREDFENFWRPLIFPELVSRRRRPALYSEVASDSSWNRADSINWNTAWTEFIFPEYLWESRNSGTLLRDWEEALTWIYIEYSWDKIFSSFNNTTLNRVR